RNTGADLTLSDLRNLRCSHRLNLLTPQRQTQQQRAGEQCRFATGEIAQLSPVDRATKRSFNLGPKLFNIGGIDADQLHYRSPKQTTLMLGGSAKVKAAEAYSKLCTPTEPVALDPLLMRQNPPSVFTPTYSVVIRVA